MVMRAGFGVGMNIHGACPEFTSSCAGMGDSRSSRHAGRLRRVEIELRTRNDLDAMLAPIGL
jgi:hypothetical protein